MVEEAVRGSGQVLTRVVLRLGAFRGPFALIQNVACYFHSRGSGTSISCSVLNRDPNDLSRGIELSTSYQAPLSRMGCYKMVSVARNVFESSPIYCRESHERQ
jgi:hypothetical protein